MPRKRVGDQPMTVTERVRAHRARKAKPVMVTVYGSPTKANSEVAREIDVSSRPKVKPGTRWLKRKKT